MRNLIDFIPSKSSTVSDWTPVLNAANAATAKTGEAIAFPCGVLPCKSQPDLWVSQPAIGDGNSGTSGLGTVLRKDYDEPNPIAPFFGYGNANYPYLGSGGIVKNITIYNGPGFAGGTALGAVATDDAHRPVWLQVDRFTLAGMSGSGPFHYGIRYDGSACTTPNASGERLMRITNSGFCGVTTCTLDLRNMVAALVSGCHVFTSGGPVAKVSLTGGYLIDLAETGVWGDLEISGVTMFGMSRGVLGGKLTIDSKTSPWAINTFRLAGGRYVNYTARSAA